MLCGKYNQKFLDLAEESATDSLKTSSKKVIQKQQKLGVIGLVMWFDW